MVLLHVLIHRTAGARCQAGARLKLLARIELGVAFTWCIVAAVAFRRLPPGLLLLNTAYVAVVSLGLGYCYFILFALSETALRIRLLLGSYIAERQGSPEPGVTPPDGYNPAAMIDQRIDRLLAMGAAREEGTRIFRVKCLVYYYALSLHLLSHAWRTALFGASSDGRSFVIWKNE